MINILFNKNNYFLNIEDAKKLLEINALDVVIAQESFDMSVYETTDSNETTNIKIPYYLLEEVFDQILAGIRMLDFEQATGYSEEEFEQEQKQIEDINIRNIEKAEVERVRLNEEAQEIKNRSRKVSSFEENHTKSINAKIENLQKLSKYQQEACEAIKVQFICNIKMFECSNGIIMDGNIKDALNIENGISYLKKQSAKTIVLNDYYNNDHEITLSDAQIMADEIEENFYKSRTLKQNLYNQIKNTTDISKIIDIRFKI